MQGCELIVSVYAIMKPLVYIYRVQKELQALLVPLAFL